MQDRVLGITCPLFSLRTRDDWGKGQISDLLTLGAFGKQAGAKLLQILPPHALGGDELSPYGALSAFALDPTYVTVARIAETKAPSQKLAAALARYEGPANDRERLAVSKVVDYKGCAHEKLHVLSLAFDQFLDAEWNRKTARADAVAAWAAKEPWVAEYALFATYRARHNGWGFSTWPEAEKNPSADTLARARTLDASTEEGRSILREIYYQFVAFSEWSDVKRELAAMDVALMGDLPFIVGTDSADVWAHRASFDLDVLLGAPPDEFAADGQDWGLPAYSKEELATLRWLSLRSAHAARMYDAFRIDHVVGFFRQWVKPRATMKGEFHPADEAAQEKLGAHVLAGVQKAAAPARVIAEDLGVIPPFVRATLTSLGIPGYKVVPWEKDERFVARPPSGFPKLSVATFGTHDTPPITSWWNELEPWEREQIGGHANMRPDAPEEERHEKLTRMLLSSPSDIALLQIQELLGDGTRVNLPGTVGPHNWTYRIDRPLEDLMQDTRIAARLEVVRRAAVESGR